MQEGPSTVTPCNPQLNIKAQSAFEPIADEIKSIRSLLDLKKKLLQKVQSWIDCPCAYRNKLYNKILSTKVSEKNEFKTLESIKMEVGLLEFNLQLNTEWQPGVLILGDEIVHQTHREQREALITHLGHLKEELGLLMQACHRYHALPAQRDRRSTEHNLIIEGGNRHAESTHKSS